MPSKWLPVNVRVDGRLCVLVGGGGVSLRKGRKLLDHGAIVRVVAPDIDPQWDELARSAADASRQVRVHLVRRPFSPADLERAFVVVAATSDPQVNARVAEEARGRGAWIVAAEAPEEGDLTFPATLREGDLTVSFATDGASPALAARLKREASERYGEAEAAFCRMARDLREGEASLLPPSAREAFFRALVDSPVLGLLQSGEAHSAAACARSLLGAYATGGNGRSHETGQVPVAAAGGNGRSQGTAHQPGPAARKPCPSESRPPASGRVFLIGAGPGDPGLLTLKGAECLHRADVVLFDSMVNPLILEQHCGHAERIDVGKRKGCCKKTQDETTALLIELAHAGRVVARLKGGDPMIFGRGGEEARALRQAGVDFEIVPGVSCVAAAPAYAGIPLTDRDYASSVGIYTAHRRGGLTLDEEQWRSIARGPDTLVFLMGKTRCTQLVQKLMEHGRSPRTPMAIVSDGTLPRQVRIVGTLESFLEEGDGVENNLPGPGMIVIGEVVRAISRMDWFRPGAPASEEVRDGADPALCRR